MRVIDRYERPFNSYKNIFLTYVSVFTRITLFNNLISPVHLLLRRRYFIHYYHDVVQCNRPATDSLQQQNTRTLTHIHNPRIEV